MVAFQPAIQRWNHLSQPKKGRAPVGTMLAIGFRLFRPRRPKQVGKRPSPRAPIEAMQKGKDERRLSSTIAEVCFNDASWRNL